MGNATVAVSLLLMSRRRYTSKFGVAIMEQAARKPRRVGILGYGALGQYLVDAISGGDAAASSACEIAFVWNRSPEKLDKLPALLRCTDLSDVSRFSPDLIVEVCHPGLLAEWGAHLLTVCDVYMGSPTALADPTANASLRAAACIHGLYVPAGALWGAEDLARMNARGTLVKLRITMAKHPLSLKLEGELGVRIAEMLASGESGPVVLYDGPTRKLCALAPNNVNTMAAAAIAAPSLGFDGVEACLVADATLNAHVITVEAIGPAAGDGQVFHVITKRSNPAPPGAVTGRATFASFLSSVLAACNRGVGVHLC